MVYNIFFWKERNIDWAPKRIKDTIKDFGLDHFNASLTGQAIGTLEKPIYQSERNDLYNGFIENLLNSGHAFYCKCIPSNLTYMERIMLQKKPEICKCSMEDLEPNPEYCVRFKVIKQIDLFLPILFFLTKMGDCKVDFNDIVYGKISQKAPERSFVF